MVRKKTTSRNAGRCLIAALLLLPGLSQATAFKVGKVTQAEGKITFLNFTRPYKAKKVKPQQSLMTEGSYLTQENSFLTVELFEGSWLRLSSRTKISVDYDPTAKIININLLTGSIKVLFSSSLNDKQVDKIIIKSIDAVFESSDGKFSVVRNPVLDLSSVFVEKGTVVAAHSGNRLSRDVRLVHTKETTSLKDRETEFEETRQMTEKEIKFLHPSFYLKHTSSSL
ncbi:MAG: FecR domain-containing protein [Bdellovibrionales bacterium]|nr:FecR domain-containing protein [Bdellovibrionales bacterium]